MGGFGIPAPRSGQQHERMAAPHFDDVRDIPLVTDEQVLERATQLLDHAMRRQLWIMFYDADGCQLPLLMPSHVPARPTPTHHANYARVLGELVDEVEADAVTIAYERRGGPELVGHDAEWLALVHAACREAGVRLRGPLLVHDGGLRWVGPDDLC